MVELLEEKDSNGFAEKGKKKVIEMELMVRIDDVENKKGDDFEFSFECASLPASPVPADVAFFDWKMKQRFPIIRSDEIQETETAEEMTRARDANVGTRRESKPLWELMKVEKELAFPSSSSAADEIEAVAVGAYCVWNPPLSEKYLKSKSTRSSKWWPFRNLLRKGSSVHEESARESPAAVDGVGRRRRKTR